MLARLFRETSLRTPDRTALIWDGGQWTYREMQQAIDGLRQALGDERSSHIGILSHKSPTAYAAVQAILSQACAYVPLNPAFPSTRNAYIARKAGLSILIVDEGCADALEGLLSQDSASYRLVVLGEAPLVAAIAARHPDRLILVHAKTWLGSPLSLIEPIPEADAYALFTSGSTGMPKGVRVLQRNVLSYVRTLLELYPIAPEDRLSQTFDLTFDLSVHDQFVCWAAGATLVVFPDRTLMSPLEWTRQQHVTVWFSVPSLAAFLESARQVVPDALPDLRLSLFCGEKLTWNTCRIWRTVAPNSRLANLYGPTEATIAITHFEIPPSFGEADAFQGGIPIGRVFPGQGVQIRREDGSLCDGGETGGLWLGGAQVTAGYLGDPEKTAERFVSDGSEVWYRTGDLVFEDAQGVLQYVGREDFQVKVMGYRIELGEIEYALMKAAGCTFALADVGKLRSGIDEIFCVLPAGAQSRKKALRQELKELLPPYMVPRHFFFTDDIPLNSNGKMDRPEIRRRAEEGLL